MKKEKVGMFENENAFHTYAILRGKNREKY
jgi:hypothetical protein